MTDPTPDPVATPEGHSEKSNDGAATKAAAAAGAAKNAAKAGMKLMGDIGSRILGPAKGFVIGVISLPLLLFKGDLMTRVLTAGFLASLALLAMTSAQLFRRFIPENVAGSKTATGQGVSHFLEEEKKIAIMAANVLFLERFSGSLDSGPGKPGVFEIELYVETDAPESAAVLRKHLAQTREMVSSVIQGHSYDELITEAGRTALKKVIQDAVNRSLHRWQTGGSVKRVLFTRFIMG